MPSPTNSQRLGFHHLAIRTSDYDASLRFYGEVLGFTQTVQWQDAPQRATMLDTGDGNYLEIFERPDQAPPKADDAEPIILHLALRTDDIEALLERVREAGCTITVEPKSVEIPNKTDQAPSPLPVRIAFFKGPDGEVIELFQNQDT